MVEQMIILELSLSPIAVVVVVFLVFFSHSSEAQSAIQPATPLTFGTSPSSVWDVSSLCVIIGSLIATLLLLFVLLILLRRFTISHTNYVSESNNKCEGCYGIHPQLLQTFPILCYSPSITKHQQPLQLQCAVCLAEFNHGDTLRLLPQCNHVFHPPCIDAWLSSHVTCPVCRANLSHHHYSLDFATISVDAETSGGSGNDEEEGNKRNGEEEEDKGERESASKVWKLMRSNSTGHLVVVVEEDVEKKNSIMRRSASYNFVRSLC